MNKLLRCGVIGLGVGMRHAMSYMADPRCELVAVCDNDPALRQTASSQFHGAEFYGAWQEMLDGCELDVLSVASYDDAHADQVVAGLQEGMHVFCEKPLCQTTDELLRIRTAWVASGRHLMTNLVLRAAPAFKELRHQIREGVLGDIFAFEGDYLYGRLHKITEGWRGRIPFYSVMQGGGVHMVDLLQWCLGELPSTVVAVGNRIATRQSSFRYPDYAAATFCFPSGIIGRISANFGCLLPHQHMVRAYGTKATFLSDGSGARLISSRDTPQNEVSFPASLPADKGALITELLDGISAPDEHRIRTTESHLATMQICLAADEAMTSGQLVNISYESPRD